MCFILFLFIGGVILIFGYCICDLGMKFDVCFGICFFVFLGFFCFFFVLEIVFLVWNIVLKVFWGILFFGEVILSIWLGFGVMDFFFMFDFLFLINVFDLCG